MIQHFIKTSDDKVAEELRKFGYIELSKQGNQYVFINDSKKDAECLSRFLKGLISHVNLIPANNIKDNNLKAPPNEKIHIFARHLMSFGVNVTVHRTL